MMQKAVFFLLLVQVFFASLFAQNRNPYPTITLVADRISVGEVLEEISRQSGLNFSFNSRILDKEEIISFSVRGASLESCLDQFVAKVGLRYRIIKGQIVLNTPRKGLKKVGHVLLSGFLSDRSSGESLIGAMVHAVGTSFGTFTNEFGYYALSLAPGNYKIAFSHVGYEKTEKEINLNQGKRQNVSIPPVSFNLSEVIIAPSIADLLDKKQLDAMSLRPDELNDMPEFLGESGLVKGMQSLPGIQTDGDGSAYFYARGGNRDQNLVIIDDAPVYNPSHLFGFYSMVIPDFVRNIEIYKGDMPAQMGDRLSSIVSIRTKDGNLNKWEFRGAINPFVSRYSLDIPIKKEKSSLFISSRQSNFDWLYEKRSPSLTVKFNDFHIKWNHKINDNNQIFFTSLSSQDLTQNFNGDLGTTAGIRRSNSSATLRWNHLFNPELFSNMILYSGSFANQLDIAPNFWKSELGTLGFKWDFTNYAGPNWESKFGFELQGYFTNPGSISVDSTLSLLPSLSPNYSSKLAVYYQSDWEINEKWTLHAGIRLINWARRGPEVYYDFNANFEVKDTVEAGEGIYNAYVHADPRVSLQYQIDGTSQLKLSAGSYHQYLQLISNSISPFTPMEIWLPSGPNLWPQSAQQWSLGYSKYLEKSGLSFSAAAYHKKLRDQIDYESHPNIYLNPLIEGELRFGKGRSYGLELLLKKETGSLSGWMAYTYSRSFRTIYGINEGQEYRARQDRPHDFSLFLNYQLSRRSQCSMYWTSYSGATFTSPIGFFDFNGQRTPIYGSRNNARLPAHHRMDISFQFVLNKKETRKYQHSLTFSMQNVLGMRNPYVVKFNKVLDESVDRLVKSDFLSNTPLSPSQVSMGRFLPSISYRFKI